MKKIYKFILTSILIFSAVLYSGEEKEIKYKFIQDDNYFSFQGSFIANAKFDCLINVIYKFEHISNFSSGARSIKLGEQGENWYNVTYTYRRFLFFENQSVWRRTLKRDQGKVIFEMLASKNNVNIMPELSFSKGYYQIKPEEEGYLMEYFQEGRLKSGLLKGAYIKTAKKEAINFLNVFKEYVEKTCD